MSFTSVTFMFFHLLVVALRWTLPRRWVAPMLLVSSYAFYLSWGPRYAVLIGGLTLTAWGAGRVLARRDPASERTRRWVLGAAVTAFLVLLAYFKYANFLLDQWAVLRGWTGHAQTARHLDIVLPLAISFYSFEVICYVVDVSRGTEPEPSLWRFALYISYYPHLVAGPIVRPYELLPQLRRADPFDGDRFAEGVYIALRGYLKKMVLADNLAPFADAVFATPSQYSTLGTWLGVLAYTGQIYCDFSGYTDIARGASLMLGYPLPENFDLPYLSGSIAEFWRRWHMTLSRWLRDYLYISLGGNRRGVVMQYRNLFLTMLLGGLWHGANWTFVAWGAWHGGLLALHRAWDSAAGRASWLSVVRGSVPYRIAATAITFVLVVFGWVLFRAPDFGRARRVATRMVTDVPGIGTWATVEHWGDDLRKTAFVLVIVALYHLLGRLRVGIETQRGLPPVARGFYWAGIVLACWLFSESRASFIYFQF